MSFERSHPIDSEYLVEVLTKLVRINSVNPKLVQGSPGEKEIARSIAEQLRTLGVDTVVDTIEGDRSNVISMIRGIGKGPSLMINAHMDTVGTDGMKDPFSAKITEGRLYGRGAQDMKGSIAAMLSVAKALKDHQIKLKGDLLFSFVIDEEYASLGTEDVVKKYKTDAAIVTEPTNLDLCLAHRGFANFEIKTFGRQAHGGSPHLGIDANMLMGHVLNELALLSQKLQQTASHPYLGQPSLHVPMIRGGKQLFIYADECALQYERRTLPGETEVMVQKEIHSLLDKLEKEIPNFKYALTPIVYREAFEINPEKSIVKIAKTAISQVRQTDPQVIGHGWWEDSALFAQNGTDTIIIGPTGDGIHSPEEWVDLQSVNDLSQILLAIMFDYCGLKAE